QDWIYAAPLIVRDEDSNVRDFDRGENDWFVALGSESGWEPVERWTMPSRLGGNLSTPGVDYVHNTQHLNTTVTHHFLDDDFYSHNGGIGITFAVRTVPTPALIKPSVSFDLGNGVTSSTLACAAANMPTAACGAASGAVNMAQSQGHEAMGTLSMMTGAPPSPSVGLGIRVNQHGVHLESVYVPVFGDLLSYNVEESALDTYQYQGLADLDGDGRVDFVSTRFDDGTKDDPEHTELNAPNTWLFYRNTGSGFEEPVVWHMPPDAPNGGVNLFEVPPSYLGVYGVFRSAMHIDYQKRWTDKEITWQDGTRYLRYSETIQRASLADLNSDGLLDLVGQDFRVHGTGPQTQHHLSVHYNLGNQFSDATHLEVPNFELDNRVSPGNTAGVSIYPSMMVGGHINADTSVSRQVQGLFDVNQDGLLDVTFIPPTQTVDGYSSYFGEQNGTDGVPESFISPAQLNAPIKVALNTGRGFAPPVTWVDASAFALSGGVHDMRTSTPKSVPFTALGDYDHDGLVELAVRDPSRALLYDMEWDIPVAYSLYELHRPNVDVLDTLTTPFGGQMEVEYGIEWDEGPEMPTPIWVTRAITTRDIDPTRSDITHHYTYEHGSYDRPWKSFRGFERIYTYADDQGGWTMTRYLQERGFEHLPYCTEVREHVTGSPTSNLLTDQVALRRMAWSTTPSGLVRSGYTRALVYGDSTRLTLQPPPELAPPGHDDVEVFDGIDPYATASPSEPLTTDAAEADDT
ncbi:MAG: toxin TcdB middle/N-terminal domain-containing protein, partial [Myxococcota bacterium]